MAGTNWGRFAAVAFAASMSGGVCAAKEVTYYYTDPQGTVLMTTDEHAVAKSVSDYRPFGLQSLGTTVDGPGFTGHVGDSDSSLMYMRARYFDPVSGRFLSIDPARGHAGNVDEFNVYSYVANNPLRRTDPDGRQTVEDYAKLNACPVQCSLVRDSGGQWMAVPTAAAGRSFAASELGTNIGALDQATGKQIAQGTDNASAVMSGASLATVGVPPVALALDAVGTGLAVVSLIADPSADHALNVATAGMFGVAKAVAGENKIVGPIIETAEVAQKVNDVREADERMKKNANE